jgi:hypothetical protein
LLPIRARCVAPWPDPARWLLAAIFLLAAAMPARALVRIDFEPPYFVHPDMQVWDFCLVPTDSLYNIFYHAIPESDPQPRAADHIWRATSPDLVHWSEPAIALSVTGEWYESEAVWAPDVIKNPLSDLWFMAYTGVDAQMNQRICMAWSSDLANWGRVVGNPQIDPDPGLFRYVPANGWAICRDPYLFLRGGVWHLLATAQANQAGYPGVLLHSTSGDLFHWLEPDIFLVNDGAQPDQVLESSTYLEREGTHHLFFHQSSVPGVQHVYSDSFDAWTMANRQSIGLGIGPEVDTFDDGLSYIISRLGQFRDHPDSSDVHFVAHFGSLEFDTGDNHPDIVPTSALAREFAVFTGEAVYGNPVLGDNPTRRGDPPVGLVGNGYFGSAEFFQGPLGYGIGGGLLGDEAQAHLESHPFVIEGNSMSLLIGGTASADCYVALMDAEADTILRQSFAEDNATMDRDYWDVQYLQGREAYILVVDADEAGHLNVDDIVESFDQSPLAVRPAAVPQALRDLGPRPNPFNPRTELRFALSVDAPFRARVHDLRGRLIWDSGPRPGRAGINVLRWDGRGLAGERAPGGVYVYRVEALGRRVSGKVTLLP